MPRAIGTIALSLVLTVGVCGCITPAGFEEAATNGDTQPESTSTTDETPRATDEEPTSEDGLPSGIHALAGLDPSRPFDDLEPLGEMVGQARFVGIGEAVHTSGGLNAAKQRLIRFLVEQLGFRSVGIESPWIDATWVDDYVSSCEGDPLDALERGVDAIQADENMRQMLLWMCDFNRAHPGDEVRFFGFDTQQPWLDGPALIGFVERFALDRADAWVEGIEQCNGADTASAQEYGEKYPNYYSDLSIGPHEHCLETLGEIEDAFAEEQSEIIAATSAETFAEAEISLVSLRAWEGQRFNVSDPFLSSSLRDAGMAEVIQRLASLRFAGQKVIVWAANVHIATNVPQIDPNMAFALAEKLGADWLPLGLVGYSVSTNWPGMGPEEQPVPDDPAFVEKLLHDLGKPHLLVDLDFPGTDPPFLQPSQSYFVGGLGEAVPRELFRALVYVDVSPPMDALFY